MDKVIIRDLLARGPVGITEEERSAPQDLLINLWVSTNMTKAFETDEIADCVNYSKLTKDVLRVVANNRRKTLEALAADLVDLCLSYPLACGARVRVEKTSAVRFTGGTGVEIERGRL